VGNVEQHRIIEFPSLKGFDDGVADLFADAKLPL
jgi:hypothetical protein